MIYLAVCLVFGVATGLVARARGSSWALWGLIGALLGGPLFFMAAIYRGGNRYDIIFDTLVNFDGAESKPVLIDRAITRYAEILEKWVIDAPYNWFNFFDFWQAEGADDKPQ